MVRANKGAWVLGAVLASLAVLAAGWFGLMSPTLSGTAAVRDRSTQTEATNQRLEASLVTLKKDYARLPELKSKLATAQQQIPTTADLPTFLREVNTLAASTGVQLSTVAPGTAVAFGQTAAMAAGSATTGTGLQAVPVTISVQGSWHATVAFVTALQEAGPRLIVVQSVSTSGSTGQTAGGQAITVTGQILELASTTPATTSGTATSTAAPTLPTQAPGTNPLSGSAS